MKTRSVFLFVVMALCVVSCQKDEEGIRNPKWWNWGVEIVNTSGYDVVVETNGLTKMVPDLCSFLVQDTDWVWHRDSSNMGWRWVYDDDSVVFYAVMPFSDTVRSIHRRYGDSPLADSAQMTDVFSPAKHNAMDKLSYRLHYDYGFDGYVYQYTLTCYDLQ